MYLWLSCQSTPYPLSFISRIKVSRLVAVSLQSSTARAISCTNDLFYLIAGIKLLSNKRFLPIWQAPKKSPPLGQYTVYIARDENKNVIYVGMTNNFLRRRAEHANRFMIEKYRSNLTKYDARALEQALIEHYKFRRDGGTLLNKINSISRKNPIYEDAIKVGNSYINNL